MNGPYKSAEIVGLTREAFLNAWADLRSAVEACLTEVGSENALATATATGILGKAACHLANVIEAHEVLSDVDAGNYRLQQAERLMASCGYVKGDDGKWRTSRTRQRALRSYQRQFGEWNGSPTRTS